MMVEVIHFRAQHCFMHKHFPITLYTYLLVFRDLNRIDCIMRVNRMAQDNEQAIVSTNVLASEDWRKLLKAVCRKRIACSLGVSRRGRAVANKQLQ